MCGPYHVSHRTAWALLVRFPKEVAAPILRAEIFLETTSRARAYARPFASPEER